MVSGTKIRQEGSPPGSAERSFDVWLCRRSAALRLLAGVGRYVMYGTAAGVAVASYETVRRINGVTRDLVAPYSILLALLAFVVVRNRIRSADGRARDESALIHQEYRDGLPVRATRRRSSPGRVRCSGCEGRRWRHGPSTGQIASPAIWSGSGGLPWRLRDSVRTLVLFAVSG